ncbi:hypothetical protein AB6G95_19280 [Proteus vulgaris]|uniref:hypothetical protein n=1 Tax=Proteus vulgaris TaxID=585 RepID=UPI0034DD125A
MSLGRLHEIAENQYGNEEMRWMAAKLLSYMEAEPLGYVDMTAVKQMQRGETDSAALFLSPLSTPVWLAPSYGATQTEDDS